MAVRFPKHEAALAWALRERGVQEDPPGSNTGPRILTYQHQTWLGGTRWPWCAAFFVSAWQLGANRPLPYRGAGAYAWLDWARINHWAINLERAIPGDAVVFNIGSGHIAILARPYAETRPNVETIDGNVSDMVAPRTRSASVVRGCIHVPEDAVKDPPPAKPPMFEVVTSASGHAKVVYVSGAKAVGRKLPAILNRWGGVTIRRRKNKAT